MFNKLRVCPSFFLKHVSYFVIKRSVSGLPIFLGYFLFQLPRILRLDSSKIFDPPRAFGRPFHPLLLHFFPPEHGTPSSPVKDGVYISRLHFYVGSEDGKSTASLCRPRRYCEFTAFATSSYKRRRLSRETSLRGEE